MSSRPASRALPLVVLSLLSLLPGCASLSDAGPSLAPRAAEAIDPRLPIVDSSLALTPDPQLAAQLSALRGRAIAAAAEAEPALRTATAAVASAGAAEGESWVLAQQSVSAAIAARAPFTAALGDLDALLAARVRTSGRLVPRDLAGVRAVVEELGAIDGRQAGVIAALEARLQR